MRVRKLAGIVTALLAFAACSPAAAEDITLRYASDDPSPRTLVIEADDAGRIRAEDNYGQLIFLVDGASYLAFGHRGERVVARLDDHMVVGREVRERMIRSGALNPSDQPAYALQSHGAQRVGQYEGLRYSVDPISASGATQEMVVSTDPALARAREVAVPVFETLNALGRAVLQDPPDYVRLTAQMLSSGMPISVDGMELKSISNAPIPAARFDLPQAPMTIEELRRLRQ